MKDIKGSQTEKNLLTAFAGEAQARNRYTYFASVAKKEGFVQVQNAFLETADHEKEHAKRLFKYLKGGEVEITAAFPAGTIASTLENLQASAAGEHHEYSEMYPSFAEAANDEGFADIAKVFASIAHAERYHEQRYLAFIKNIKEGTVFKRSKAVQWKCNNCGYVHDGLEAPDICPACDHPQAHYELLCLPW